MKHYEVEMWPILHSAVKFGQSLGKIRTFSVNEFVKQESSPVG